MDRIQVDENQSVIEVFRRADQQSVEQEAYCRRMNNHLTLYLALEAECDPKDIEIFFECQISGDSLADLAERLGIDKPALIESIRRVERVRERLIDSG